MAQAYGVSVTTLLRCIINYSSNILYNKINSSSASSKRKYKKKNNSQLKNSNAHIVQDSQEIDFFHSQEESDSCPYNTIPDMNPVECKDLFIQMMKSKTTILEK